MGTELNQATTPPPVLEVRNLSVNYKVPLGTLPALRSVSLTVNRGEVLSIVGESGSGKSTLALAVSKLLPPNSFVSEETQILFRGKDVTRMNRSRMDKIRGTEVFMIFQNPFMSLNPLMKIKDQVKEALKVRDKRASSSGRNVDGADGSALASSSKRNKESLYAEAASVLKSVRIGDAEDVMERYPHQLSGGQNQRVMLAMALAERPSLLIADEPTTALDVTTQAQVLSLLKEIIRKTGMSVVFITHDLAVAGSVSDRIAVLYGGMVQELGTSRQVLFEPKHPYTFGLIKSIPSKTKRDGPLEAIKGSFSWGWISRTYARSPRAAPSSTICAEKGYQIWSARTVVERFSFAASTTMRVARGLLESGSEIRRRRRTIGVEP